MKKLFYTLCIAAIPIIIGVLTYQRILRQKMQVAPQNAQTIIPVAPQLQKEESSVSEAENIKSVIALLSDEILISDIPIHLSVYIFTK